MRFTLIFALGLVACGNSDGTDTGDQIPDDALQFTDANTYGYTADIEIGSVDLKAGADGTIDWCALTTDLRGRPVTDPSAVNQVLLVEFALTPDEIEAKVEANDLKQSDSASQWVLAEPGDCTAKMSEFEIIGNTFDPGQYMVEDPDRTWLVSVTNTPDGRLDILMSAFVVPLDGATSTTVALTDTSATLTMDPDLSGPPIQAKAGDAPWINWSQVTVDATGKPYDNLLGDRLLVGKVPVETLEEVEERFLRLDLEAENLFYLKAYGETAGDLSKATASDGEVFGGFTTDGIWLVGIECLTCTSPAPLILSVVQVTE